METLCFVGTYSRRDSVGVYSCAFDNETGTLRVLAASPAQNPTFLALSPDAKTLLASLETGETNNEPGGGLASFRIEKNGSLTPVSVANVRGIYPCHVAVSPSGKWAVTSQYAGGTHSVLPLSAGGNLGAVASFVQNTGTPGTHPSQKDGAHAHSAFFTPGGDFVITCDLGLDTVFVYRFDDATGAMTLGSATRITPPGTGPRQSAWSPMRPGDGYVVNEHGSSVTRLHFDTGDTFTHGQTVPTLPPDIQAQAVAGTFRNQCAQIAVHDTGRFVYASNRGHDSIAVFTVDDATGDLSPLAHIPCGGKEPRHFALIPGTPWLLCAHQDSDTIATFRIGDDGLPVFNGAIVSIPAPVCVVPTLLAVS